MESEKESNRKSCAAPKRYRGKRSWKIATGSEMYEYTPATPDILLLLYIQNSGDKKPEYLWTM